MEGNRISAWDSVLKGYCAAANKTNRKSGKEDLEGRAGSGGVRKFTPGGRGECCFGSCLPLYRPLAPGRSSALLVSLLARRHTPAHARTHSHMENINVITKSKRAGHDAVTRPRVIQSQHPVTHTPEVIGLGGGGPVLVRQCCRPWLIIGWLMCSRSPASQRVRSSNQEATLASWSRCHIWTIEMTRCERVCVWQRVLHHYRTKSGQVCQVFIGYLSWI